MILKKKDIIKKINDLSAQIILEVDKELKQQSELDDYEIVWKQFQDIAAGIVQKILEKDFPGCKITIPKSKSTYPDIKMEYSGHTFAIDIKSNESQKEPWYDIARLDTIIESRINKFDEEWELVIKYDSETKEYLNVYFELLRETVGYNKDCKGVKYRPYDGKVRPKSWKDFDKKKVYWKSKEEFIEGLKNSQIHRWKKQIKDVLIPILKEKEKEKFKRLFD